MFTVKHDQSPIRPAWLAASDIIDCRRYAGSHKTFNGAITAHTMLDFQHMIEFSIADDHWAIPALQAGMTPWQGGETGPRDWNAGTGVLLRNGVRIPGSSSLIWWHSKQGSDSDIIGYHRYTAAPDPIPGTTREAIRMAQSLAITLHAKHYGENTKWRVSYDLTTVIDQIDNMTAGLERRDAGIRAVLAHLEAVGPNVSDGWKRAVEAIREMLPKPPVDPDLIEARRIAREAHTTARCPERYTNGELDKWPIVVASLAAIKHGKSMPSVPE